MCSVWKGLPQSAMYYSALPSASFLAGGSCGCVGAAVLSGLSMTMTGEVCWAVSLPPMAPAIRDLISNPIPEERPSVTCVVPLMMSPSSFALLPSPYIVILSTLLRGSATFLAISGKAFLTLPTAKAGGFLVQRPQPARARSYMVSPGVLVRACPALP